MSWNVIIPSVSQTKRFLHLDAINSENREETAATKRLEKRRMELERRESLVNARLAQYEAVARRAAVDDMLNRKRIAEEAAERETIAKKRDEVLSQRELELSAKEKELSGMIDDFSAKREATTIEFEKAANELREKERLFEEKARVARNALKEQRTYLMQLCDELERRAA